MTFEIETFSTERKRERGEGIESILCVLSEVFGRLLSKENDRKMFAVPLN